MLAALGRMLIFMGAVLALFGGLLLLLSRLNLSGPLLPGDIVIRRPGLVIYIPIATSILLSIGLTLLLTLLALFWRR